MNRFEVRDGTLWHENRSLGTGLVANPHELSNTNNVAHSVLPYDIDMVLVVGNKAVGIESKVPEDLLRSQKIRRLARQLTILLKTCDVACLLLRGGWAMNTWDGRMPTWLWRDLVAWQAAGIYILPGPVLDSQVAGVLDSYKPILAGGSVRGSLYGDNLEQAPSSRFGKGWLLRGIKGLGPKLQASLYGHYGSVETALAGTDSDWKACGANRTVIKNRKEAMN